MNVLETDSIQKRYEDKLVISDVYLKCRTGQIIGLLGRNGSGKSTLLKIIFGITPADSKFIRINGVVMFKNSEILNEISYLPQDSFIPNYFSVKKAIALSINKNERISFCQDEMIQSILDKKIKELSGGELRYLEIKLVMSNPSKFVLLDEPYNGLAPVMITRVNELIKAHSIKKGVIITDHNYQNIIKVSTDLILMKEGKVHHLKDKHELIEKGYLLEGML